jgi:membrane fusion protein, copper/silver efflux system
MVRKAIYSVALCTLAGAAFLAGSLHSARDAVTAAAVDPRTPLYYRCPMHPNYTSDKPGISPCCGMKLEPVYASTATSGRTSGDAQAAAGTVAISPEQQQLTGVREAVVELAGGTEQLRLYGRVMPEETRVYKVNAGLDGFIQEASQVTTGSYVAKEQWLATFATPEIRQPISAFIVTIDSLEREQRSGGGTPAQLAAANTSMAIAVDRLRALGMAQAQIEEIRKARVPNSVIKLVSPVEGFVVARNVSDGEKFERGAELFRVADLHRVWILADVPTADAGRITPGIEAQVTVAGRTTRARVSGKVLPQFDPSTQSMKVRLEAENPGFVLRPEMFVDVDLQLPYAATIVVPGEAVIASGLRSTIYVERQPGLFEPRTVKTGRRFGDRVQILEGLTPGERIAVSGTFLLDSESRMHQR